MTFTTLGLSDSLLRAVAHTGYTTPTPIQIQAIPAVLSGGDVMAAAQTGTGKTAGFVLPMLQQLGANARAKPGRARALIPDADTGTGGPGTPEHTDLRQE